MFVDDLKIFKSVSSAVDAIHIQEDLNRVSLWCDVNRMNLNTSKCFKMIFTRSSSPLNFHYTLGGGTLPLCSEIKDLGVIFDSKLTFTHHVQNIVSKAYKMLGFVQRLSVDLSIHSFTKLYYCFVRSVLEYCSVVWSPCYGVWEEEIERVQKKFLRVVAYPCGYARGEFEYSDVLRALNLCPLILRRQIAGIVFLHGVIEGYIKSPELLSLVQFNITARRGRHTQLFTVPFHPTNYGKNDPLTRMLKDTNSLLNNHPIQFFSAGKTSFKQKLINAVSVNA